MDFADKKRKRILIFLFIPVLIVIPFLTDDLLLRIISALILVIYAGFIIFLRDKNKSETEEDEVNTISDEYDDEAELRKESYDTDDGEEFKIISPNKSIEVITSDNFTPPLSSGNKEF